MFQEEKILNASFQKSSNPYHKCPSQIFTKVGSFIFSSGNIIGKGNFSKVYKGVHQFNQKHQVAIKVIQKKSLNQDLRILVDSQLTILKLVNHQNIIKCYEIKQDEENIYIVMELCEGGDLQSRVDKMGPMSEEQAAPIIKGVLKGLLYLSQYNIIHRDIKAANIFIHNNVPKIADFGFAIQSTIMKQFQDIRIGSPIYMSPEGIKHNVYGPTTDVWSFGVFVYQLLHGKTPYWHCTKQKQLKYNITNQIRWNHFKPNLSYSIKEVIFKCLEINYEKRITFHKLQQCEFFKQKTTQFKNQNKLNQFSTKNNSFGKIQNRILEKNTNAITNKRWNIIKYEEQNKIVNKRQRIILNNDSTQNQKKGRTQNENFRFQIMENERKRQQKCITEMKNSVNKSKPHSATKYKIPIQLEKCKKQHSNLDLLMQNSARSKRVMSQFFALQQNNDSSSKIPESRKADYKQVQTNNSRLTFLVFSDRNYSIDNQPSHRKSLNTQTNRTNNQNLSKVLNFPSQSINCYLYLIHFSRLIYKLVCHMRSQPNLESISITVQKFCVSLLRSALTKIQTYHSHTYSSKNNLFASTNQNSRFLCRISQTITKYVIQHQGQLHHSNHNFNPQTIVYENSKLQKEMNRILSHQIKTDKPNCQLTKLLYLSWVYSYHFNGVYLKYFLHLQSEQWYRCNLGYIIKQIETDIEFSNSFFSLQSYLKIKRSKILIQ